MESEARLEREVLVPISADLDIVRARQLGRELGERLGFSRGELALLATAISELARNILQYAGAGRIVLSVAEADGRRGLQLLAEDEGPGIADVEQAMQDGFSTSNGLGLGLPGVRRLMDDFQIESAPGRGTKITARKWVL